MVVFTIAAMPFSSEHAHDTASPISESRFLLDIASGSGRRGATAKPGLPGTIFISAERRFGHVLGVIRLVCS
jgi:hypothetical protein